MLVQDTLTGYLHEVPDYPLSEPEFAEYYEPEFAEYPEQMGEVVYDGLGNPVGFLPFIPKIAALASKALPMITSALPQVGRLVGGLFRPPAPGAPAPGPALPGLPFRPPMPGLPFRLPIPPGWTRPLSPLMARAPMRRYMRCSVWPGPPGLVPISAAQPPVPPVAPPGVVPPPPAAGMGRRRIRFRRRR